MIDPKDEIVRKAENEISEILTENLTIAAKAVNVYDEYLFILQEPESVQEFLSNPKRDRDQYIARIQRYLDTIEKIKNRAPFEIRLSMFLVQCHELNNRLIHECEKLIDTILKHVYDTNQEEASWVINQVRLITDNFSARTDDSAQLVAFEDYLGEVSTSIKQMIVQRYQDLIMWV